MGAVSSPPVRDVRMLRRATTTWTPPSDDGSCDFSCVGCTEELACNYDMNATMDSGDCTYPLADYLDCDGNCLNDSDGDGLCDEEEGCGDPVACNYDPTVVESADYCLIVDTVAVHPSTNPDLLA